MSLSNKRYNKVDYSGETDSWETTEDMIYSEDDVKEFIKQLKKEICQDKDTECPVNRCSTMGGHDIFICYNCGNIDKLAGDKLI